MGANPIRAINQGKFFIMSTEFDKNISDLCHDPTDHKNGNDFFMSLIKWPKQLSKKPFFLEIQEQKLFKFDATQN